MAPTTTTTTALAAAAKAAAALATHDALQGHRVGPSGEAASRIVRERERGRKGAQLPVAIPTNDKLILLRLSISLIAQIINN